MNTRIATTLSAGALVALFAATAPAQIPMPPVPNLQIHIATEAPPHLRHERRSPRPGPDYVWINGAWAWEGGQWAWVPGRWDRPAERHARWVSPRYAHDGDGYRYEPGHWSNERIVEGDDYREWHARHHNDRNHDRSYDREHRDDRDHDRDRDRDRDHQR